MKDNRMIKRILPVLLAALVVFSSLGLGGLAPQVQAEETPAPDEPAAAFPAAVSGTWLDQDSGNNYKYIDTKWYTDNSSASSYSITTAEELAGLAKLSTIDNLNFSGKTITITGTIDLGAHYWIPVKQLTNVKLIGNECILRNVYMDKNQDTTGKFTAADSGYGLIASASGGSVKNINVENGLMDNRKSNLYVGMLFGDTGSNYTAEDCRISNSKIYMGYSGNAGSDSTRLKAGFLAGGMNSGNIKGLNVENCDIYSKETNFIAAGKGQQLWVGLVAGDDITKVENTYSSGNIFFEKTLIRAARIVIGGIVSGTKAAGNNVVGISGCMSEANIIVDGCTIQSHTGNDGDSTYIGGLVGKCNSDMINSQFEGSLQFVNNTLAGLVTDPSYSAGDGSGNIQLGGSIGKMSYGTRRMDNVINSGEITVSGNNYLKGVASGEDSDDFINAGGLVGTSEATMTIANSYSIGTMPGEDPLNSSDRKGAIAGNIYQNYSLSATNVFFLNVGKAFGSAQRGGAKIDAIPLAKIILKGDQDNQINEITKDETNAIVSQGDQKTFEAIKTAGLLGASFAVELPEASQFTSSNTQAAILTDNGNSVGIQPVKGGQTTISASVNIHQNQLDLSTGTYTGTVVTKTADANLPLNIINVDISNTSNPSAIKGITDFGLTATLQPYGAGVDLSSYTYTWEYAKNDPGTSSGTMLNLTPDQSITGTSEQAVTWSDSNTTHSKFTDTDAGWYRLTAKKGGVTAYESDWKYIAIGDLMIIKGESDNQIELSDKDTPDKIPGEISAVIQFNPAFAGTVKYGWYKNDVLVEGSEKTMGITENMPDQTIGLTLDKAEINSLSGQYVLRVTEIIKAEETIAQNIKSTATVITVYSTEFTGTPELTGGFYAGLPATLTQTGITLSEDLVKGGYTAYWVKGGRITDTQSLADKTSVIPAGLIQDAEGITYTASSSFTMIEGSGNADYQLLIWPVATNRVAIANSGSGEPSDTAMQLSGSPVFTLPEYAIKEIIYNIKNDGYNTVDLVKDKPLAGTIPTIKTANPGGTLVYGLTEDSANFEIDKSTGEIICKNLANIRNGTYTLSVKVQETGYKTGETILSGPYTSQTIRVSFQIGGFSEFPLNAQNLYIYDNGYILGDSLPDDPSNDNRFVAYSGKPYILVADGEGATNNHQVVVVSGTHTGNGRIILRQSIATDSVPAIEISASAAAQLEIVESVNASLSTTNGVAIKNDGDLSLTGGGSLNLSSSSESIAGKGATTIQEINLTAGEISQLSTTIESGHVTAGSITGTAKTTIKGGNVKADTIGTSGATIIDGGSIIGAVSGNAKNSDGETVYPVTLKVGSAPADYADAAVTVTTQKTKADGTTDGSAKTWTANASDSGELYVYLPDGGDNYTRFTATAAPASGTPQTLSRKINADTDGSLTASLLATTYSVTLPQSVNSSETVAHGVTADITIGMNTTDGWLYEGRSIGLEISPGDGYKTIWGNYQMKPQNAAAQGEYSPEFWIQTPSGSALSKAGYFGTLTDNRNDLTGQLIVPADSSITEGTYQSQLNWKIIPNDPVVGGNQPSY